MCWEIDLLFELSLLGYNALQPLDIQTFLHRLFPSTFAVTTATQQSCSEQGSKQQESKKAGTWRWLIILHGPPPRCASYNRNASLAYCLVLNEPASSYGLASIKEIINRAN